jgi:hypothetical protein
MVAVSNKRGRGQRNASDKGLDRLVESTVCQTHSVRTIARRWGVSIATVQHYERRARRKFAAGLAQRGVSPEFIRAIFTVVAEEDIDSQQEMGAAS